MAKKEHLDLIMQTVEVWNKWRFIHPKVRPNLSKANLGDVELGGDIYSKRINLTRANLRGASLRGANLFADLSFADLRGVDLTDAILGESILEGADLSGAILLGTSFLSADLWDANFSGAELFGAKFHYCDLTGADLSDTDLTYASFIETNLSYVNLEDSFIYGISVWNVNLDGANQSNLIITREYEPTITVDNLEIAQFIYLLINNKKIRSVIDTITTKVVLILGRFTPDRKLVLDALRDSLRQRDYLPVLFDWDKPVNRDFIETVSTLAHLAKFVIADVTDSKIVLEELPHIVRNVAVPVKPLMLEGAGDEPITLYDLRINHRTLLDTYLYKDLEELLASLEDKVINPVEEKLRELSDIRSRA